MHYLWQSRLRTRLISHPQILVIFHLKKGWDYTRVSTVLNSFVPSSVYLNLFTAEHIARLCALNNLDIQEVKTKSERIACLSDLPHMVEEDLPKQSSISPTDLFKVMQQMDMSRKQETEQLCTSFMKVMSTNVGRADPDMPGLHKLRHKKNTCLASCLFEKKEGGGPFFFLFLFSKWPPDPFSKKTSWGIFQDGRQLFFLLPPLGLLK